MQYSGQPSRQVENNHKVLPLGVLSLVTDIAACCASMRLCVYATAQFELNQSLIGFSPLRIPIKSKED